MEMVPALVWPRVPLLSVDWRIVMVPALVCRKDPSASWEDATMTVPALVLALTRPLMPMISRVPALHLNIEASRHVDIHIDVANMKEAQEAPMLDVDADPIAVLGRKDRHFAAIAEKFADIACAAYLYLVALAAQDAHVASIVVDGEFRVCGDGEGSHWQRDGARGD